MTRQCPSCGGAIAYAGRGRPRKYCEACTPPGCGGAEWRVAWLAEHGDELEAERLRQHEKKMREWRENSRQIKETIAQNRRELERRKRVA